MYDQLRESLDQLLAQLPQLAHGELIARSLEAIASMAETPDLERLDWKLVDGCLQDMQRGIKVLHPFRHIRKVSIFGSARTPTDAPEYEQAQLFAQAIAALGFLVFTGAGNGIMAASNQGAGLEASFGLNINLPFEQSSNPFVASDRLVSFKYFFTRKLFFLKESDAVAIFPGGFGTQDELFECLTLCQTGKATPRPIVLLEPPGSNYWEEWSAYVDNHLLCRDLISPGDRFLYRIFNQIEPACEYIQNFYSCYHSSRWVGDLLVLRLNYDISDPHLAELNRQFQPLLAQGQIYRTDPLAEEQKDAHLLHLPRLAMHFNQRDYGSLQKLIEALNNEQMASPLPLICHVPPHPEQR
ncbi:MAG: LOG family protein [Pseudanabaenaceae cyanobacterium bins.68]|nr:LOG family protein [Pseudanabaenaceae cyanobacterium bins.68]